MAAVDDRAGRVIAVDNPTAADVRSLIETHRRFAHDVTPATHVHALPAESLSAPDITFYSARRDGALLAIGALRRLDARHAEIKSMHTASSARRSGVAAAMVAHLIAVARAAGYERLSLETGTGDAFVPATALYTAAGFTRCPPFGEYTDNPHSVCMTMRIGP